MNKPFYRSIVIVAGFFIISLILILNNLSPDIALPSKPYKFYIDHLGDKIIRDFFIFYDFKKEQGYIKFRTAGKENIPELDIEIPKELFLENIEIIDVNSETKLSLTEQNFPGYYRTQNRINVPNINKQNINVIINFTNKNNTFYPNGIFDFQWVGPINVTLNQNTVNGRMNSLLYFIFGDRYRCSQQCFKLERIRNQKIGEVNERVNFFTNENEIMIVGENTETDIGARIVFTLGTYDLKKRNISGIGLSFGIGLVAGLINGLTFILIRHLYKKT